MAVEAVSLAHFCESGDWNYSNFLEIQKVRILWMKRLISLNSYKFEKSSFINHYTHSPVFSD